MGQTKIIRQSIPQILKELNAKLLLDALCGDFTWIREIDLGDIPYMGVDMVDELIEENNIKFPRENRNLVSGRLGSVGHNIELIKEETDGRCFIAAK